MRMYHKICDMCSEIFKRTEYNCPKCTSGYYSFSSANQIPFRFVWFDFDLTELYNELFTYDNFTKYSNEGYEL